MSTVVTDPEDLDTEDPIVREAVDRAVAPFVGKVTPGYLAAMRAAIADMLVTHPATEELIRSLRERAPQQKSEAALIERGDGPGGGERVEHVGEAAPGAGRSRKAAGGGQ